MPAPLLLIPAIKLIATGVAIGVVAYQLNKTYEGQAIKLWFDKVVKGRAPHTPEGVDTFLKKYYGIDIEAVTSILIQMQAILDTTKKKLKTDKDIYALIKQALKENKVQYGDTEQKNILAVVLDIYRTLKPSEGGKLYSYLRGAPTPIERQISTFKKDVKEAIVPKSFKTIAVVGGIAIAGLLFYKYGLPLIKKARK